MKKLIFLLCLLPAMARAQVHFGIGAGYDVTNSSPLVNINVGYTANNNVMVEAIMQPSVTRAVNSNNFFGIKAGYKIANIIPAVGYYYDHRSSDDKGMNTFGVGYSLKYLYLLGDSGGLFAEGLYINRAIQITAGFHVQF